MSISGRTITSVLILAFKAVCVIGVNRWMAMKFGPDGFAQYSHFLNALTLFLLIPSEGIGKAIVKYLSDPLVEDKNRFIAAGWVLHVFALVISAALIFSFPSYFLSKAFPEQEQGYSILAIVFTIVVYGHMVTLYMQSVLLGLDHFKSYTIWQTCTALLPVLVLALFPYGTKKDYIIYIASAAALMAIPAHAMIWDWSGWKGIGKAFTDLIAGKIFMQWIAVAAVAVMSGKGVEFIMRTQSIDLYGATPTGLWQSVVRFSDYYMAAVYGLITMVYYPRLSSLVEDGPKFRKIFFQICVFVMLCAIPGLLIIYKFRGAILDHFFSPDFIGGVRYFSWQLLGDGLRILAAICGMVLLVRERLVAYTITQLVYGAVTVLWISTEKYGHGIQYIHATTLAAFVYCFLTLYLVRKDFRI